MCETCYDPPSLPLRLPLANESQLRRVLHGIATFAVWGSLAGCPTRVFQLIAFVLAGGKAHLQKHTLQLAMGEAISLLAPQGALGGLAFYVTGVKLHEKVWVKSSIQLTLKYARGI